MNVRSAGCWNGGSGKACFPAPIVQWRCLCRPRTLDPPVDLDPQLISLPRSARTRPRRTDASVHRARHLAGVPGVRPRWRRPAPAMGAVIANEYRVIPNITYLTASNWEAKLDVYRPAAPGPHPVVLHIHGGGWVGAHAKAPHCARCHFWRWATRWSTSRIGSDAWRRRRPLSRIACAHCDGSRATPKSMTSTSPASSRPDTPLAATLRSPPR